MNEIWQSPLQTVLEAHVPILGIQGWLQGAYAPLAQTTTTTTAPGTGVLQGLGNASFLTDLIRAIIILVVGWLIALVASAIVKGILQKTNLDNKLANWVTGRPGDSNAPAIEKWISSAVFWIIFIFTIVAFLQALDLQAVSEPLNNFLNQVVGYIPRLAGAAILLGVAWLVATIVKLIVTRALDAFGIDERLGSHVRDTPPERTPTTGDSYTSSGFPSVSGTPPTGTTGTTTTSRPSEPSNASSGDEFSLSKTIGNTLYWFIFLLFLPAILNTLGLQGTLEPVQQVLNEILAILPNILAAILIGAAGWLIAQVVRRIVTNFLAATGTDQIGSRFGLTRSPTGQSLSWIVGTIVYVLILIPTAIAALNALQIDAISDPAVNMLDQILSAIPQIFTAGLILVFAYVAGRFVAELVTNLLSSVGFDNLFYWLGLQRTPSTPSQLSPPPASQPEATGYPQQPTTPAVPTKTPSELIGIIVLVGIMLFAAVSAIDVLNIPALTAIVSGIVLISGRILAGLIVFAVGLYLANLAFNLITSSGTRQSRILGQTARIAIIGLISAMALQQMGVATDIVNLAFGLLLGAIAVAIAIAFGLGGRDIAAEQIREWLASFKQDKL